MTQLLNGPWRGALAEVVSNADDSLLLAAPFIKRQEADWLCELLPKGVEVTTLTNIDPDAVSSSALDMAALGLREARAASIDDESASERRNFSDVLSAAKPAFAEAQVGTRSAHAVFGDAIRFVLAQGPLPTKSIEEEVSRLLPLLCDDTEYLYIRGERYGKAWKRTLRHAQQHLKRIGVIERNPIARVWALRSPSSPKEQ